MPVGRAKKHKRKHKQELQLTNYTLDYADSKQEVSTEILSTNTKNNWNHLSPFLLMIFSYVLIYTIFFSPAIFYGKLLAPGDGFIQYLPAFLSPRTLWTTLLYGGYPVAADIQNMTWYPLSLLFSLLHSWNIFVLSTYVMASSFTFGLVYTLTHSKISGFISGLIFGMSGFFMAHLGHATMIQSAAWLPAILLCLEKLKPKFNAGWLAGLGLTTAMSFLAGFPQIFVYSMGLAGLYALITGWNAPIGRLRYYVCALLGIFLGICLTAIQLLPSIELSKLSLSNVAKGLSFQDFVSYSLRPKMLVMLLFPYILGVSTSSLYGGTSYFGPWNLTELTGYIGILPLILAIFGASCYRKHIQVWFWGAVAILCLLLVLGDSTPLATIMYHLPGYNLFIAPARHFLEYSLAVSILAGYGIAVLLRSPEAKKWIRLRWSVIIVLIIFMAAYLGIIIFQNKLHGLPVNPLKNLAVGIPLLIMILVGCSLFSLKNIPEKLRYLLIILLVIIDLGSFGQFYEWKYASPTVTQLTSNQTIEKYKNELSLTHQRMMPVDGTVDGNEEIEPNLSRLWGVPSASGYGPLLLARLSKFLNMGSPGNLINDHWAFNGNQSLDLMAVRYLFIAKNEADPAPDLVQDGIGWSQDDNDITLGSQPYSSGIDIAMTPHYATQVGLVTALADSVNIPNGTAVGKVTITTIDGKTLTFPVLAGRDTSEWAWDRSDVQPVIKHQRAEIFSSLLQQEANAGTFEEHTYLAVFPLGTRYQINDLKLQWLPQSVAPDATFNISKISLTDKTTGLSYPVTAVSSALLDTSHWQHVEDLRNTVVYANLRAMPRAWLVPQAISLQPDQVLNATLTSKLPDGSAFNPQDMALVEKPLTLQSNPTGFSAQTVVTREGATSIDLIANTNAPAFLVLSDIYYPGWKATVDGQPAQIFQTDYALRGIVVPSGGRHAIHFYFCPTSFYLGLAITLFTILLLIGLVIFLSRRQKSMALQTRKRLF
jgi:hypothetical protein